MVHIHLPPNPNTYEENERHTLDVCIETDPVSHSLVVRSLYNPQF